MPDYHYAMIVYWSEPDSCYLAEVPDLPGCVADGATPEQAVANARVRIDEWVTFARELGREIPVPIYDKRTFGSFVPA